MADIEATATAEAGSKRAFGEAIQTGPGGMRKGMLL
jgi:hypothetical protein